jgi:hypothetical protein
MLLRWRASEQTPHLFASDLSYGRRQRPFAGAAAEAGGHVEIVQQVRAPGAAGVDLVVMGTHGRRGPSLWWLGSVAGRVLRDIGE